MSLLRAAEQLKELYQIGEDSKTAWDIRIEAFFSALSAETDASILEETIKADENWELPFDERTGVFTKRIELGDVPDWFMIEALAYKASHLDSEDPEYQACVKRIAQLDSSSEV